MLPWRGSVLGFGSEVGRCGFALCGGNTVHINGGVGERHATTVVRDERHDLVIAVGHRGVASARSRRIASVHIVAGPSWSI